MNLVFQENLEMTKEETEEALEVGEEALEVEEEATSTQIHKAMEEEEVE